LSVIVELTEATAARQLVEDPYKKPMHKKPKPTKPSKPGMSKGKKQKATPPRVRAAPAPVGDSDPTSYNGNSDSSSYNSDSSSYNSDSSSYNSDSSNDYSSPSGAPAIGDRLLRTFGVFKQQPLTVDDATSQGWAAFTDCNQFGIGYAKGSGPTRGDSAILYFTSGGQLSGFGSRMWGSPPESLVPDYWIPVEDADDNSYDLIIQTRDPSMVCSGATDSNLLGDRISVNGVLDIPLDMSDAQSAGWVEGNCIPKMGIHHAYDLNTPGQNSWNASSLVPVLPMFNPATGAISAVLLASSQAQHFEPVGDWEGPFINMLMCKNWCANTGCTFPGVALWTTMHWLFEDPSLNQCTGAKCIVSLL